MADNNTGLGALVDGDLDETPPEDIKGWSGGEEAPKDPDDDLQIVIEGDEPVEFKTAERESAQAAPKEDERPSEDDDEDSSYSKRVRARIEREQRLKEKARAEAKEAVERVKQLEEALAQFRAKEVSAGYEEKLAEWRRKKKEARAELDTDAETEADEQIARLTVERVQAEREAKDSARQPEKPATRPEARKRVDKWLERNKWFDEEKNPDLYAAALRINADVAKAGFDDETDEYYRELDKRIRARLRIPGAVDKNDVDDLPVDPGRDSPPSPRNTSTVHLTRTDLATMRQFGLDPDNKEHVKEFARERARSR